MPTVQDEINTLVKRLQKVSNRARSESKKAFRAAAKPMIEAIKAKTPVSDAPHYRYNNGKRIVYYPGNLRRSIRVLALRRTPAVFIGPKVDKSGAGTEYKGNKVDAYYAHMVEFGTEKQRPQPYMRPGALETQDKALRIASDLLRKDIEKYGNSFV